MIGERRKIGLLCLLMLITLMAQNAHAEIVNDYLPHSSHYQGRTYFPNSTGGIGGKIEFAVYDTEAEEFTGEQEDFFGDFHSEGDESRQYIYAYQIICEDSYAGVLDYFGIVGIGENAIANMVDDIDSVDDASGDGVNADISYITSSEQHGQMGVWQFENGHLTAGEHSWFLVLRSDHDWQPGKYTLDSTLADQVSIPNPEPATIALLGFGSLALLARKKR